MKLTSSQAAKLLRGLNEEHALLMDEERESSMFVAALQENLEDARPPYDFEGMQKRLDNIEAKIRVIKHALNVFNLTHQVPGFDMTIDQVLIYLPQLTKKKDKLTKMSSRLEKQRSSRSFDSSPNIEYHYTNYSIPAARAMLTEVADTMSQLQTALDLLNTTEILEIDI